MKKHQRLFIDGDGPRSTEFNRMASRDRAWFRQRGCGEYPSFELLEAFLAENGVATWAFADAPIFELAGHVPKWSRRHVEREKRLAPIRKVVEYGARRGWLKFIVRQSPRGFAIFLSEDIETDWDQRIQLVVAVGLINAVPLLPTRNEPEVVETIHLAYAYARLALGDYPFRPVDLEARESRALGLERKAPWGWSWIAATGSRLNRKLIDWDGPDVVDRVVEAVLACGLKNGGECDGVRDLGGVKYNFNATRSQEELFVQVRAASC